MTIKFKIFAAVLLLAISAGIFSVWTPDTDPVAMRKKYASSASRFIDVDGMKMHVRDQGPRDAPVIVLVHGSGASLQTWIPWTARFSKTYRVISLDLPGHGLTGPHPKRDYSAASFVSSVDGVAQKLGVKKFVLGGQSLGGGVVLAYALAHPEKLNGLILVSAAGAPESTAAFARKPPLDVRIARTPVLRNIGLFFTPRSFIEGGVNAGLSVKRVITPEMIDWYWELIRYPGNRQAAIDRANTSYSAFDPKNIQAMKVPTLILWGEQDAFVNISNGKWFEKNIRGSKFISYKGVGHAPMEEVADQSVDDVLEWISHIYKRA